MKKILAPIYFTLDFRERILEDCCTSEGASDFIISVLHPLEARFISLKP